jgi:hypothetical protein
MATYLNFLFFIFLKKREKKTLVPNIISLGNLTTISPALRPSEWKHQRVCLLIYIYTLLCVLMEITVLMLIMCNFSLLSFFFFFEKNNNFN